VSAVTPARRLVIAGFDADPGERFDRLRDLVVAVIGLGWEPDVVLVGDGDGLGDLRRLVPVTVVDEFRRRGLAFVPHVLGLSSVGRGLKRMRLQRWLRSRGALPWIVADTRAAAVLRYAEEPPRSTVGCLSTAEDHVAYVAPADRAVLERAVAWLVDSDQQAAELSAADLGPALVVGRLARPDPSLASEPTWPLLLVPTPGAWSEVNHTIEVAERLIERHPSIPVHWLVRSHEDEWLARFDLDHLGLIDLVTVIWPDEAPAARYRTLVRTGYGPDDSGRCREAADAGIPVVAFEDDGATGEGAPLAPFDVEGLVAEVERVLPDEATIRLRQERYQVALEAHADAVSRLGELLDGRVTGP